MKKHLVLFSIFVIFAAVMLSCSKQAVVEDISTTAITDTNGVTHYYEIITDESSESTTLVKLVTDQNGKTVTDSRGKYITEQQTTVPQQTLQPESSSTNATTNLNQSTSRQRADDNDVSFETSKKSNTQTDSHPTSSEKDNSADNEKHADSNPASNPESSERETSADNNQDNEEITDEDGWINKWY